LLISKERKDFHENNGCGVNEAAHYHRILYSGFSS